MRFTCKECPASYRHPHDLEEHQRVGHAQSSNGPTWSDKDVDEVNEEPVEEAAPEPETPAEEPAQE
jgi:hypothetical protein